MSGIVNLGALVAAYADVGGVVGITDQPPCQGYGAWAAFAQYVEAVANHYDSLGEMAPPPPEPGIHWTRTGGKSWRVEIVR